ncbi:serine protease inhibitor 3/4-like [Pararge aegeria]|uniref:serine protease inhibitor 3/4-like n=1 Tax=Pararge aegeria TaxID=116150 RepID=UPI0019D1ABFC|nr:serine protease inhibitor 3/4-like [Pararge aegeria]
MTISTSVSLAVLARAEEKALENVFHDASSKFASKMLYEVAKINTEKSFAISPFSVLTPLALLSIAARDTTRDELWEAIGTNDDNSTKEIFTLANDRVKSLKGVTVKMASKLYLALNYDVYTDFGVGRWDSFGSELQNIDFDQNVKAAQEVNAWVEKQTNNHIKDIVSADDVDLYTRALLVDVFYFKGQWKDQFEKSLTREKDFHVNNKDTKKVSMMYRRGNYKFTESSLLKSQVIEIPYKDREASLVVVLPRDIEGIKDVQEILKDPTVLQNTRKQMYDAGVELYLPKFKIETTTDLKDVLQKMNVTKIFSAHLCRLDYLIRVRGNMYIAKALQKASFEVDEGTSAAVDHLDLLSIVGGRPYVFIANRPFIFYVLEGNNIILNGEYYA